jgi:small subunit ribosomal protein S1
MSEQVKSQEEFLANFNWHNFEEIDAVDEKKLIRIRSTSFKTFIATDQEEVVDGELLELQIETLLLISTQNRKVLFH